MSDVGLEGVPVTVLGRVDDGADDAREFRDFVEVRSPALLRTAWMLTGDAHQAEDLLQTALVKTWPRWEKVARAGALEAYVRRTMFNTYVSWWRLRSRGERPTEHLPDTAASRDDEQRGFEVRDDLMRALAALPRGQRAVLVLRFFEDMSEAETARVLGCSVGTVKSQASRALTRLRLSPHVRALVEEQR